MRLFPLALGFSLIGGSLPAQEDAVAGPTDAPVRQGIWGSLGAGFGSHGVSCYDCIGAVREGGFTTSFRLGGTIGPHATLGVDLIAWVKPLDDPGRGEYAFLGALMGELQFYPVARQGFFLLGGGGYIVDVVDDDLVLDSPGIALGIGYDLRTGGGFSLTPQLRYLRTIDGGSLTSSLYQLGIALTWH